VAIDLDTLQQVQPEVAPEAPKRTGRAVAIAAKIGWGFLAFGLFVGSLQIMKAGAEALIPALSGGPFTDNAWSTLGLGWLGACLVLSGSPMAASSIALLDGGAISRSQAFTMLTGSRLGASFVVLAVGFIYALRRKSGRRAPLSIGILSLTMTVIAYVPGALLGFVLLRSGSLDAVTLAAPPGLLSVTDTLFGWMADLARNLVPGWALFPAGLGVLLVAFKLFDRVLPDLSGDSLGARRNGWFARPWAMFGCGCAVAFMTLSVSVALTLLVPLVAKGYLKREHTLPYIAGANITTLADTLVLAMLTGNPDATRVVLASTLGVTVWTIFLLAFAFPTVRKVAMGTARSTVSSRPRLALFIGVLLTVPLGLVLV
jgi:Na+/phosphate symporter